MTLTDGRIGQLLDGKYRVEELLARGGMGVVYGARHEATGRPVAVKLLRAELAASPDFVRRVVAEARLAVDASHPNVVEVLDAGTSRDGVPYLVLERLFGATLENLLTRPLPLLEAARALVPVVNALCALHRAGIVHRDIKPANVFIARDAHGRVTPKLLDFGIAKALEVTGATHSGTALGTPAYMAPEQALGSRNLGPPTDVWAMGITLARCLTGVFPFDASTNGPGSLRGGLDEPDFPGVPAPVARSLARALRFEPSERFADMSAFREALFLALGEVDAAERWPDALTVSLSPGDTELFANVARAPSETTTPTHTAPGARGRDLHVVTRTLLRDEPSKSAQRRLAWIAGTVLAFAAAASAVAAWREPRAGATAPVAAAPLATNGPEHVRFATANDERARPAEPQRTTHAAPAPAGSVATPSKAIRRVPASGAGTAKTASSADAPASTAAAEPARPAQDRPLVGANRSPIIE